MAHSVVSPVQAILCGCQVQSGAILLCKLAHRCMPDVLEGWQVGQVGPVGAAACGAHPMRVTLRTRMACRLSQGTHVRHAGRHKARLSGADGSGGTGQRHLHRRAAVLVVADTQAAKAAAAPGEEAPLRGQHQGVRAPAGALHHAVLRPSQPGHLRCIPRSGPPPPTPVAGLVACARCWPAAGDRRQQQKRSRPPCWRAAWRRCAGRPAPSGHTPRGPRCTPLRSAGRPLRAAPVQHKTGRDAQGSLLGPARQVQGRRKQGAPPVCRMARECQPPAAMSDTSTSSRPTTGQGLVS